MTIWDPFQSLCVCSSAIEKPASPWSEMGFTY